MKDATKQWLDYAQSDLLCCEKILDVEILSNIIAFHSQQVVEKCLKAVIEEKGLNMPRIHNLLRLELFVRVHLDFTIDLALLTIMNEVYTATRYPGDAGLLPDGKPSIELSTKLYELSKYIYENTLKLLSQL